MFNKIAVYGAGNFGRFVIDFINGIAGCNVVLVSDGDCKKWGTNFMSFSVVSPDEMFAKSNDFDAVFVAINSEEKYRVGESIAKSASQICIYNLSDIAAERIFWDISGLCNAECMYCSTGRKNRLRRNEVKKNEEKNMSFSYFKKCYEHLIEKGIVSKKSNISLYNWYEPFVNPDIMQILKYLSDNNQDYELSTNASILRLARYNDTYKNCVKIIFSVPGYSQESYSRIHSSVFSAEKIRKNIELFKEDMCKNGFSGRFEIAFHKYSFNDTEYSQIKEWAKRNKISVRLYGAYLNGNRLVEDYFEHKYDDVEWLKLNNDLKINWAEDNSDRPNGDYSYICDNLTIDSRGNRTLCNYADEFRSDYDIWGSILDYNDYEDVVKQRKEMLKCRSCDICRKYQIAYRILRLVTDSEELA